MANIVSESEMFFNSFEPKTKNRFTLGIDGVPAFLVVSSGAPSISSQKQTLSHINVERYYKGKSRWADIDVVLYDAIVPSASQAVMEWVRLSHESVTGRDGYQAFYKKDLTFTPLGPVGDKVSEWLMKGCFITSANFDAYSYEDEGRPAKVAIKISMDYAILNY